MKVLVLLGFIGIISAQQLAGYAEPKYSDEKENAGWILIESDRERVPFNLSENVLQLYITDEVYKSSDQFRVIDTYKDKVMIGTIFYKMVKSSHLIDVWMKDCGKIEYKDVPCPAEKEQIWTWNFQPKKLIASCGGNIVIDNEFSEMKEKSCEQIWGDGDIDELEFRHMAGYYYRGIIKTTLKKTGENESDKKIHSPEVTNYPELVKLKYGVTVTNKEIEKNTEATLTCTVSGLTQVAKILWKSIKYNDISTADSSKFSVVTDPSVTSNEQNSVLTVKETATTENHNFTCVVSSNEHSKTDDAHDVILNVFVVNAPIVKATNPSTAILTCVITAISQAVFVTWKNRDGQDLSNNDNGLDKYTVDPGTFNSGKQESTLTLASSAFAGLGDKTIFICIVKSKEYSHHSPEITVYTQLVKLKYGVSVTNKEIKKNTEATLTCTVSGLTQVAQILWKSIKYNDLSTADSSKFSVVTDSSVTSNEQNSVLTVKEPGTTADQTFTCVVSSNEHSKTDDAHDVILNVFVVNAPNVKATNPSTAILTCVITAISQAVFVTWKNKDGQDLSNNDNGLDKYTVDPGTFNSGKQESTLTLASSVFAGLGDKTTFYCIVKSKEYSHHSPEVTSYTQLVKLKYGVSVKNKEVEKNTEATLTCTVSGLTQVAKILWKSIKYNDLSTADSSKFSVVTDSSVTSNEQNSVLTVKETATTADQTFTCVVSSNEHSKTDDAHDVELHVKDPDAADGPERLQSIRWMNCGNCWTVECRYCSNTDCGIKQENGIKLVVKSVLKRKKYNEIALIDSKKVRIGIFRWSLRGFLLAGCSQCRASNSLTLSNNNAVTEWSFSLKDGVISVDVGNMNIFKHELSGECAEMYADVSYSSFKGMDCDKFQKVDSMEVGSVLNDYQAKGNCE